MKTLIALLLSMPLAFAMGCGDSPSNTNPGNEDVSGNPDNGGTGGDLGVIESRLVVAQAPAGFSGDFYFEDVLVCAGATSCEAPIDDWFSTEIRFEYPKHLFLPREISPQIGGPKYVITWDDPGDWGLAPQGTYFHEQDLFEGKVTTWVEEGQILLDFAGNVLGAIEGDSFAWESEAGSKWPASMDYVGRMDLKPMLEEAARYPGIKEKLQGIVKDVTR